MSTNIIIPSVGESITEGTISRWLKKEGERVEQGEPLYELETDKANTEIPAPTAGLLHITVSEGQSVAVGATIGTLDATPAAKTSENLNHSNSANPNGEKRFKDELDPEMSSKHPAKSDRLKARTEKERADKKQESTSSKSAPTNSAPSPLPPSPVADRNHVTVIASSPAATQSAEEEDEQPVSTDDSESATTQPPGVKPSEEETREAMSPIRRRIAQRLLASQQNSATLTTFNEADLAVVERLRMRYRDRFYEKHGVKLGLTSFFVKACARALEAFPIVNASIDGCDIVYHRHCHIGVAVSVDKGLFVPVLRQAERMTFAQIEKSIADLAEKARTGTLAIQDLEDGTFTISNGGVFGSLLSTPILNPPQSAILGMHAIQNRPVVVNDAIVIRPMMYLALSYDHRLIDGRDAVQFLGHVKQFMENPEAMLFETQ